jgi:hypothetical protein
LIKDNYPIFFRMSILMRKRNRNWAEAALDVIHKSKTSPVTRIIHQRSG